MTKLLVTILFLISQSTTQQEFVAQSESFIEMMLNDYRIVEPTQRLIGMLVQELVGANELT